MHKKLILYVLVACISLSNMAITIKAEENSNQANKDTTTKTLGEKNGYLAGNYLSTKKLNEQAKFNWNESGKGFAAEQANNLSDIFRGKKASVIGDNNILNGADRKIINRDGSVTLIQDKYHADAKHSVNDAFDHGIYRYTDANGNPMQLEVPKGQGKEAIEIMEEKIKKNQVKNVSNPEEAKNIVREGYYTFNQAANIVKAGNIDSLIYDAKSGSIISLNAMGISFVLDFASCMINGDDWKTSLKNAGLNSLKVGTGVEIIHIISSQLYKTNSRLIFKPTADKLANLIGPKATKSITDAFGTKNQSPSYKNISNILQSTLLIDTVTVAIFSVPDVINLFNGRISAKQLAMNLSVIIAGTAGATAGTIIGSHLGPVGSLAGGLLGSLLASYASNTLLTTIFQTDSEEMYDILTKQFSKIASEYVISQDEANNIIKNLSSDLSSDKLKDMFESKNREKFAEKLILKHINKEIKNRKKFTTPTQEEVRMQLLSDMDGLIYIH